MGEPLEVLDGARLLADLAALGEIGATPRGGVDRVAFSPADRAGRAWVAERLREAGLAVTTDAAGNTIAREPGTLGGLAPLALGSHTDTVPDGGRYDGALGVLAALACVRALRAADRRLRHPVEVINFVAEEATLGGGTLGSRAMAGLFDFGVLDKPAGDGRPVAAHLRDAGIDPAGLGAAARPAGSLAAYLELHIEQGGILAESGTPIGVVEGIVGIRRYTARFTGAANHAGTTPMAARRDALVAAADFILDVRDIAVAQGIVGTVGTLAIEPGAPNVIPGRVDVAVEIRALDTAALDRGEQALRGAAARGGGTLAPVSVKEPVASDPAVVAAAEVACRDLGLAYRRMPSGAGHDAMCVAAIAPEAMLFVPSRDGISHAPEEYTAPEDCITGARVLLRTLLELDARLDAGA
ncbi:MAG TPA: Zn-dependent hydrolase [Thermomicrobiales bacterium]|nr:Zn-dependent hydrolase [Thermomicrobiales bacterium]